MDVNGNEPELLARYGQNERVLALDRRNFIFAGSDSGGERAAAMYTLIEIARLNGLDPEAYLATYSSASPSIRPTASTSCCLGTSHRTCRQPRKPDPFDSRSRRTRQLPELRPRSDAYQQNDLIFPAGSQLRPNNASIRPLEMRTSNFLKKKPLP